MISIHILLSVSPLIFDNIRVVSSKFSIFSRLVLRSRREQPLATHFHDVI